MEKNAAEKEKSKTDSKAISKNHYTINAEVRSQRNHAEKQRRDRLNDHIAQLAAIVPPVAQASRPLDKVSILRLAASWMRLNYSCLSEKRFKSTVENYLEMHSAVISNLDIIEKSINGFVLATTFDGVILMCSRYAEDFVGYQNVDLLGNNISNYILEKEREIFAKKIRNLISKFKNGSSKDLRNKMRAHMQQRPLPRTNNVKYRKMLFSFTIHSGSSAPSVYKPRHKYFGKPKDFGENAVILIFIEPIQLEPNIDIAYLEERDCYFTIHGPQGEIVFADHRISLITGYMTSDVLGNSAYQYMHPSDVPMALFAQKAMFASSDGTGIITYRLRIHDSSYIFLQTKGQIRYRDSGQEIRQFICCNLLLNDEDGRKELKKFQVRFAPQLAVSESVRDKITVSKPNCSDPPEQASAVSKSDKKSTSGRTDSILNTLNEICNEISIDTQFEAEVLADSPELSFAVSSGISGTVSLAESSSAGNLVNFNGENVVYPAITTAHCSSIQEPIAANVCQDSLYFKVPNPSESHQNYAPLQNTSSREFSISTLFNAPDNDRLCNVEQSIHSQTLPEMFDEKVVNGVKQGTRSAKEAGINSLGTLASNRNPSLSHSVPLQFGASVIPSVANSTGIIHSVANSSFNLGNNLLPLQSVYYPDSQPSFSESSGTILNNGYCAGSSLEDSTTMDLLNDLDFDLEFLDQPEDGTNLLNSLEGQNSSPALEYETYFGSSATEDPPSSSLHSLNHCSFSKPETLFSLQNHSKDNFITGNPPSSSHQLHSSPLSTGKLKQIAAIIGKHTISSSSNQSSAFVNPGDHSTSHYLNHNNFRSFGIPTQSEKAPDIVIGGNDHLLPQSVSLQDCNQIASSIPSTVEPQMETDAFSDLHFPTLTDSLSHVFGKI